MTEAGVLIAAVCSSLSLFGCLRHTSPCTRSVIVCLVVEQGRPCRAASQVIFVVSCRFDNVRSSKLVWSLFPSIEDERPSQRLALPSRPRSWARCRLRIGALVRGSCAHTVSCRPPAPSRRSRLPSSNITSLCDNPALTHVHGPHRSGAWRSSFSSQLQSSSLFTHLRHCVACRSVPLFALPHSLLDPTLPHR